MKKSKFTEVQILKVLKTQEEGKKVSEICREFGISEPTSVSIEPCKFQFNEIYLQTVKKGNHLPVFEIRHFAKRQNVTGKHVKTTHK